jgi:hypothetical protein
MLKEVELSSFKTNLRKHVARAKTGEKASFAIGGVDTVQNEPSKLSGKHPKKL